MKVKHYATLMAVIIALLVINVSAYASKTDSRIESSAKKSYVFKTYLKNDEIKIQSKDGAVILTGVVSEDSHKSLAEETVSGLPGVNSVDNRLELKGAPPNANSDAWVREKIKLTLLVHSSVSSVDTEVYVKDGIVTLKGVALNQAQKELTGEYAGDIEGVKDVNNEMTISGTSKKNFKKTGEAIDDSSITAQVKMALLFHRSTSALKTKIITKHGAVTVSGKAVNSAEKDMVTKLINDVKGVKSVNNQMEI